MSAKQNTNSVLVAGVPRSRGTPTHFEHEDNLAFCQFEKNQVKEIHTPQEIFPRVHEYLHACFSDETRMRAAYANVNFAVAQITEDCVIHTRHWLWNDSRFAYADQHMPTAIDAGVKKFLRDEMKALKKETDNFKDGIGFSEFAVMLRQAAIRKGCGYRGDPILKSGLEPYHGKTEALYNLARQVLSEIDCDNEKRAAELLQNAFFGPKPPEPKGKDGEDDEEDDERTGEKTNSYESAGNPPMTIIELPRTARVPNAKIGKRRKSFGPRLHRPSLRRNPLPQRLFVKKSPRKPAGTILIDASGSMGSFSEVTKWIENAPFGTVAYYSGRGDRGELVIYAKGGQKAEKPKDPWGGNDVDGLALDWLMSQPAPRIFITDRGFCGASDSFAQIVRLEQLEKAGLVKVLDYAHDN